MTESHEEAVLLGIVVGITMVFSLAECTAHAQRRPRAADVLALAQVAASECMLDCSPDEVAALAAVLRARCPECRLSTIARQYSNRVFDTTRRDERAWLAFLTTNGSEPAHWPEAVTRRRGGTVEVVPHPPWRAYRARWLALLETAARVLRGELPPKCSPDHWGMARAGSIDMRRALRAGWERIDCGDTKNAFWRVP